MKSHEGNLVAFV